MRPIAKSDRILYLDILRGMAILFIYLANVTFLSGYYFLPEESQAAFPTAAIDRALEWILFLLVDGKFYSIFSILFGIGFAVQYQSAQVHGRRFAGFFSRRMLVLLLIGLVHVYIWLGDILTLYALIGLVLVLFRNVSSKALLWSATILLFVPILHWLVIDLAGVYYPMVFFEIVNNHASSIGFPMSDWRGTGQPTYSQGLMMANKDLLLHLKMHVALPLMRLGMILMEGRIFKVLALFLIGLVAGRMILNHQVLQNEKFLGKLLLFGLLLGLPANFARTIIHYSDQQGAMTTFLEYLFYALGVVPLAIGYAAGVALVVLRYPKLLAWLAPVGKMALTNYLSQTIISISLYYGIAFGLSHQFGFSLVLLISVGIFLCQVFLSRWWLERFRFGPVEWLWRVLTYGKLMPIRKSTHREFGLTTHVD